MGLFYARVEHLDEDVGVIRVLDHQLLGFLHLLEGTIVEVVSVVEEHVVLRAKFNSDLLRVAVFSKDQDLDLDCLKGTDFLRSCVGVLDSELEGNFSVIHDPVSLS